MQPFEILKQLSFERVSGTAKELEAAHFIQAQCEAFGLHTHLEAFEIPHPEVSKVALEADGVSYACTGQGFSGNTPDEGIEASLVYIHGGEDEYIQDVEGKIVLSTGGMRNTLRQKLVEKGALGYIVTWGGLFDDETMVTQIPHRYARISKDDQNNFPGVMMNMATAETLYQRHPSQVKLTLIQDPTPTLTSHNVIATIEGNDPHLKNEEIIFTAHYDSVEFSSGAWDNASGSVTILELARYYMAHPPKRTLRFVWCGAEEVGLCGSWNYCQQHQDQLKQAILNINFDMIGVAFGGPECYASCVSDIMDRCTYLAKTQGIHMKSHLSLPSTDSSSFAIHGIPAIAFGSDSVNHGAEIHSHRDGIEHLNQEAFESFIDFMKIWSSEIVNAVCNVIPREIPQEVTKKIPDMLQLFSWENPLK